MRSVYGATTLVTAALLWAVSGTAQIVQERVDLDVIRKIREEGLERSQINELALHLTDVIGPRLTGSTGMKRANEWTAEMFEEWGLTNVTVEPWGEFGRGWESVSYGVRILTPYNRTLNAYPVAWTGSTDGTITGEVMIIQADSIAELERYRGKLKGAIVLRQAPEVTEPEFEPSPLRRSLETLLAPPDREVDAEAMRQRFARFRRLRAMRTAVDSVLIEEGVAAVLQPSSRTYGILRVGGASSARDPSKPIPPPQLVVAHEQYGRMYRTIEAGAPVRVEINVQNRFLEGDLRAYNTLGEIPGTDKADEYVMLGAHLDSWHSGTGATDNGAGSIVMMEAMRILRTLEIKPRRTIRIALWSGEEQGLLGSAGWLENHRDLWPKISAYVNVDNGTGRIRGITNQRNEAARAIFEQILWPFTDLGVVAVRDGYAGGTDHLSFDRRGIPGFNFIQDPIEYRTRSHHTFADTYERLVIDDLKQAAVVVAATVYHLAMRDEMMPRKPEEEQVTN